MTRKNFNNLADHEREHEQMWENRYIKGLMPAYEDLSELPTPEEMGQTVFRIKDKLYKSDGTAFIEYSTTFDPFYPTVPTNLTAEALSNSSIRITWELPPDATGVMAYTVYRGGIAIATVEEQTYDDIGLQPSTLYTYSVAAVDYGGRIFGQSLSVGAVTQGADTEPPTLPTGLTATPYSSSTIFLSWNASTDNIGVLGYRIFRNGSLIGSSDTTTFLDTNLAASTEYLYKIDAFDATLLRSAQTDEVSATTLSADTTKPSKPAGLNATATGLSTIQLSWTAATDNVGVVGYNVYRGVTKVATVPTTLFTDSGLDSDTEYSYTVTAVDAESNESDPSDPDTATTFGTDTQAPTIPEDLTATAISSSRIDLAWSASTDNIGVAGYKVFRNGSQIATVTGSTAYSDTNLAANTAYTYTVAAYDDVGNTSQQSASATATTQQTTDTEPPTAPANLTAIALSTSSIELSWDDATDNVGVVGYKVFQQVAINKVGYIGASLTQLAIRGATQLLGSTLFWPYTTSFGGGGIGAWVSNLTNSNPKWQAFDNLRLAEPTNVIWLELCAVDAEKSYETYANAVVWVNEIRRRIPGAIIYVSPQFEYTPAHECSIAGTGGRARMVSIANQLVTNGVCLTGPDQGPLSTSTQVEPDGCHQNNAGQVVTGQQLIDFFSAVTLDLQQIATVTETTFTDIGLGAGTEYNYRVKAYDAAGLESDASNLATATTSIITATRPIGLYTVDSPRDLPFIDGMMFRRDWSAYESAQGVYNFSQIDNAIAGLPVNQKLSIVIFAVNGSRNGVPSYVMTKATQDGMTFSGQYGLNPLPWHQPSKDAWRNMITAMANHVYGGYRLADHPKVANIDCSMIGTQGIRLPVRPSGYTLTLYRQAAIDAAETVAMNFPNKNIYIGLFGIGGTGGTADAQSIRNDLLSIYDGVNKPRICFFQENWTGHVPDINSDMGKLVYDVRNQTTIMVQACGRWSNKGSSSQCNWQADDTSPQKGFDLAALFGMNPGMTYFEIYIEDVDRTDWHPIFQAFHDTLPAH